MARAVAYTWNERGWPCRVVPISLDDLAHNVSVDVLNKQNLWNYRSYRVFALYLTHALTPSLNIQTSATHAEPVDVVIDMTLTAIQPVLLHAASLDVILLCCGHLFKSPQLVGCLQQVMSQWPILENIVGCLNTRLPASVMTPLISSLVVDALGYGTELPTSFVENWMRDEMASALTDIILFSPKSEPMIIVSHRCKRDRSDDRFPVCFTHVTARMFPPTARNVKKEWIVKWQVRRPKSVRWLDPVRSFYITDHVTTFPSVSHSLYQRLEHQELTIRLMCNGLSCA
ncbi:alpha-mannosidase [Ceratobasidium sp. AG-Ba]|nr:alpha-mannosidase [Ceratobasidium sp. AG-Ba]